MPPVINSQSLGRVEVGDTFLFCEATGPELDAILLSMAIMAVNMADRGGRIYPRDGALSISDAERTKSDLSVRSDRAVGGGCR